MLTKLEILEKLPTATKEERRELLKLARELDNPSFKNTVIHGDCLEVLKTIPDNYFDSLITDPPGGINFMQKQFDSDRGGMLNWINWLSEIMAEAMRTMKPGACGLVWSIPRTSHWTGMALELAGFRLIDVIHHCQGEGFPKGQDISKHIDAIYKAEREIIGKAKGTGRQNPNWNGTSAGRKKNYLSPEYNVTASATSEAKQWDGWKTPALKPAVEGWWLVQKPISESSIARNILKHGVGGINVEACRIALNPYDLEEYIPNRVGYKEMLDYRLPENEKEKGFIKKQKEGIQVFNSQGRYPANLILSCSADCEGDNHSPDCPVSVIGEQSGIREVSGLARTGTVGMCQKQGMFGVENRTGTTHNDQGTAARYFKQLPFDPETVHSVYYQAKASTKDRSCNGAVENIHPTVKSRYLMQYLIKLITPPDGIVLDPFAGSGTTAVAAKESGFNYVLIEKEQEYIDIINKRIEATTKLDKP